MADDKKIIGFAASYMTPKDYKIRPVVQLCQCTKTVPPAADSIVGKCSYYYRPLHDEYIEKTGVSGWEAVKTWLTSWNVWHDLTVAARLLKNRDKLIEADSTDPDWSRHANFMMRHIECGHQPPKYYVGYGYYYCSTYGAKLEPKLSHAGKKWLAKTRWGLQKYMEDGLNQNMLGDSIKIVSVKSKKEFQMTVPQYGLELDDETFTTFAFNTHPLAYLDAGLADLPLWDLLEIAGQPDIEEWGDSRTWKQAEDCGWAVAQKKTNDAWETTNLKMSDLVNQALNRLMEK
jgi:hypothetical protein